MRTHNSACVRCSKTYYRRPLQQKFRAICSACRKEENAEKWIEQECIACKKKFKYPQYERKRKTCSRECSNKNRAGIAYEKKCRRGKQQYNLYILRQNFTFDSCMIEGCGYNLTYDVHRLIPGKQGGKYEIGNMFAICPNHHAECHREICVLEKIDNSHLRAIYTEQHTDRRRDKA
jgi:hypothetical protein